MKYISSIFRISDEEKSMSQRVPKSIWVVTVLTAVILGVWPGIVLAQENYTGFVALIGWFAFPLGIYQLLTGQFRFDSLAQFQWLMSLAYPFAMLGYSTCAYWTIRRTGIMRDRADRGSNSGICQHTGDYSSGHDCHEHHPTYECGFLWPLPWLFACFGNACHHLDPLVDFSCAGMVDRCRVGATP